jgi:putative ubiquitin-RnfH superfamily antitoxin RatB of RatAB toxin-antitoxin module
MHIELVYCPGPREVFARELVLPDGSCVIDALHAAGWPQHTETQAWGAQPLVGVWGKKQPLDHPLREGDRLEVYRALRVDPKVARRERFNQQGRRSTGLFARQRPGAKSGY